MNRFDLLHTPLAGRNLIEASAGTGKTFTIAGVYLRLVLELELCPKEILVVTFTEAATKELKERIRKRLKDADTAFREEATTDPLLSGLLERSPDRGAARRLITLALRSFDEAAIFTIHGFCQRMLQENPFESGSLCNTELLTDQDSILREIAQDYWRIHCYPASRDCLAAAQASGISPETLLEMAKRVDPLATVIPEAPDPPDGQDAWLLALRRNFFDFLAAELPRRKRRQNVRSFDDLLLDLHGALQGQGGAELAELIRQRYRAALIDEFQDTDPIQFSIFDTVYPESHPAPFFMIGDPKQAIYSFRGADIFAYMKAAQGTQKRHTLLQNWRSDPQLIRAVNALFSARQDPFLFEQIPFIPVDAADKPREQLLKDGAPSAAPLKVWFTPRKYPGKPVNKGDAWEMLPESVASEICRLLADSAAGQLTIGDATKTRAVRPGDIAVLVRANRQARLMQRALAKRGIPSVLCSAGNLFESPEALELLRILSAVAQPGHEGLLAGALCTDITGVCGNDLATVMADENLWQEVLEEFRAYHETWLASGCMATMLRFMQRREVRERLLSLPLGERRLTNLLHLIETVHQAQMTGRLGMDGVISWLSCRISDQKKSEEHEIRLETDEAAVQLVTMHKSKGLEYPIVFAPFCWAEISGKGESALFHDENGKVVLDLGSAKLPENVGRAAREALAESLRLLYVALTRGKYRSYLVWGAFKDAGNSALYYLLHPGAKSASGQVTLSDESLLEGLALLTGGSGGSVAVCRLPGATTEAYTPPREVDVNYNPLEFSGTIPRDWRVASFTALASHAAHVDELPDRDECSEPQPAPTPAEPSSIFAFPRGAKAGIFLHEIFERLDFTAAAESLAPLVAELLDKHGMGEEWSGAVCSMVQNVLREQMPDTGLRLEQIGMDNRVTELEFFFPLAPLSSQRLRDALARSGVTQLPVDLEGLFSSLSFVPVRGMLRGFMDLVVEHEGRFYLLDWKSNHLGNRPEDYHQGALRREMEKNSYPLQYLLYVVALDNYLKLRIADYQYERHFGGIYYVFLRGVDGKGNGVFADRPPHRLVEELSRVLVGEGR